MSFATTYHQLAAGLGLDVGDRNAPASPELHDRVLATLRQSQLDRRLADGENANASRKLRARARQLTSLRVRERLATALEAILTNVERPPSRAGARAPVCREEVKVARDEIVRLAQRLRDPRPVRPEGVVLVRRLLSDGNGPLFTPSANDELWRQMRRAADALG